MTIAHSGSRIPPLLHDRINAKANLREIAEVGLDRIVAWPSTPVVTTDIHQCFPNLNRSRSSINPRTGKQYIGAKSLFPMQDFSDTPIYKEDKEPTDEEKEILLKQHYDPFYQEIDRHIASGEYSFFIDVHAMNASATNYIGDRYDPSSRPDICLGNNGDEKGEVCKDGGVMTFPAMQLQSIQTSLKQKGYQCELNRPFRGGNIIQTFGKKIPCIQLEINKSLYMSADDGDVLPEKMSVLSGDLKEVFSVVEGLLV